MSEQDEQLAFTPEEQDVLRRLVAKELGYLRDNRRRQELSQRKDIKPDRREQVIQAIAHKLTATLRDE